MTIWTWRCRAGAADLEGSDDEDGHESGGDDGDDVSLLHGGARRRPGALLRNQLPSAWRPASVARPCAAASQLGLLCASLAVHSISSSKCTRRSTKTPARSTRNLPLHLSGRHRPRLRRRRASFRCQRPHQSVLPLRGSGPPTVSLSPPLLLPWLRLAAPLCRQCGGRGGGERA